MTLRSLGVLVVLARIAAAQPAELTQEFQAGVDAYRLGHYDEAKQHLEKARDLDPKLPGPHRFLAAVAQAQGRWQDCIDGAREALALNPASAEAGDTKKLHDECRASAGRAPYRGPDLADSAAVAVTANVSGATVKIGGLVYGATPLAPRPITAGALEVDVEKAGWKPAHATVSAPAGIVTDVVIELEPDPNAQIDTGLGKPTEKPTVGWLVPPRGLEIEVDGRRAKPDADGRVEIGPGTHEVSAASPGKDRWRRRVRVSAGQKLELDPVFVDARARMGGERRGLAIVGGSGVLIAGGFVAALLAHDAMAEARDIARIERGRDPSRPLADTAAISPVRTRADLDAAVSRGKKWAAFSDIAYGAGIAGILVGAYFLIDNARERTDVPPPFAIAPVRGGAIVAKAIAW